MHDRLKGGQFIITRMSKPEGGFTVIFCSSLTVQAETVWIAGPRKGNAEYSIFNGSRSCADSVVTRNLAAGKCCSDFACNSFNSTSQVDKHQSNYNINFHVILNRTFGTNSHFFHFHVFAELSEVQNKFGRNKLIRIARVGFRGLPNTTIN